MDEKMDMNRVSVASDYSSLKSILYLDRLLYFDLSPMSVVDLGIWRRIISSARLKSLFAGLILEYFLPLITMSLILHLVHFLIFLESENVALLSGFKDEVSNLTVFPARLRFA